MSDLNQSITGIIAQGPGIGQRTVQAEEIDQSSRVAPFDRFIRDGMSAVANAIRHPGHGKFRTGQPDIDEID